MSVIGALAIPGAITCIRHRNQQLPFFRPVWCTHALQQRIYMCIDLQI